MAKEGVKRARTSRRRRRSETLGVLPGSLIVDPSAQRSVIRILAYGDEGFVEQEARSPEQISEILHEHPVTWVNVDGLGDLETIRKLGEVFGLHRLSLEDVVNVHQRPKVEQYEEYVFVVARMPAHGENTETEQLSMVLGEGFVLTFQERGGDSFEPVRDRIRKNLGLIRKRTQDYLAYSLLDSVVDSYFPVLEQCGERLESIEQEVVSEPDKSTITRIYQIKRDLMGLRRAVWPLREAINALIRDARQLVSDETRIYLRDCYDHTVQIIDMLEMYRETASSLVDFYLSSISNRMNEVMKVLTIIATIFIPLSFIAGLYGMNFSSDSSPWNMPELHWYWGYPFALGLMAAVAAGLLIFFRRKGWLG
jgi:magnesium transporter